MATPRRVTRSTSRDPVPAVAPSSVGRTPGRRLRSNAGSVDGDSNGGGSRTGTRPGGTEQGGSRVTVPIQPTTSYGTDGHEIGPPLLQNNDSAHSAQNILSGAVVEATTARRTTRVLTTIAEGEGGVGDDAVSESSFDQHSRRGSGGHRSTTQITLGFERGFGVDATYNQTHVNAVPAAHAPPLRWWNRISNALGNGMIAAGDAVDDCIAAIGARVRQSINITGNGLTTIGNRIRLFTVQTVGNVLNRLPNPITAIGFAARQFYRHNPLRYFFRHWKVLLMSLLLLILYNWIEPDLPSAETLQRGLTNSLRSAGDLRNHWTTFANQMPQVHLPHLQIPHINRPRECPATPATDTTCTPCDFDSGPMNELVRQIDSLKKDIQLHNNDIERHDDHVHQLQSSSALHDQLLDQLEKICCNRPHEGQRHGEAINFFATGNGAIVDPFLTSPTKLSRKLTWKEWRLEIFYGVYFRSALGPVAALMPWEDVGDCWCAPPRRGKSQITILSPFSFTPTNLVVEHIHPFATLDIGSAPKEMELWIEILDDAKRENVVDALSEMYTQDHAFNTDPNDLVTTESGKKYLAPAQALPHTFVKIGKWEYSITRHSRYGQTMHVDIDLKRFGVETSRLSVRVNSNQARVDYTCIYRLKMFGDIRDEERPHYFTGKATGRVTKVTYQGESAP